MLDVSKGVILLRAKTESQIDGTFFISKEVLWKHGYSFEIDKTYALKGNYDFFMEFKDDELIDLDHVLDDVCDIKVLKSLISGGKN